RLRILCDLDELLYIATCGLDGEPFVPQCIEVQVEAVVSISVGQSWRNFTALQNVQFVHRLFSGRNNQRVVDTGLGQATQYACRNLRKHNAWRSLDDLVITFGPFGLRSFGQWPDHHSAITTNVQ